MTSDDRSSLFDQIAVAIVGPKSCKGLDDDEALSMIQGWCAELERRLATTLRETDQAFRVGTAVYAIVFSSTTMAGAEKACARLSQGLTGGLSHELLVWPPDSPSSPQVFARGVVARASRLLEAGLAMSPQAG